MFTGIVEEIGGTSHPPSPRTIKHLTPLPVVAELNPSDSTGGTSLTISLPSTSSLLSDAHLGDSIAVNGVCLTVVTFTTTPTPQFTVGIAPETLRLTNLGSLAAASRVNLERAVRADTRMGGHFVQGHVDSVATILARTPDGNAVTFRFAPKSRDVLRYIVYKGFVALDGASLTVTQVDDEAGWFEVMLIAYTQERIVTAGKQVGETVNVEVDMTAKYVEKSLQAYLLSLEEGGGGGIPLLQKMVERTVAQGFS